MLCHSVVVSFFSTKVALTKTFDENNFTVFKPANIKKGSLYINCKSR